MKTFYALLGSVLLLTACTTTTVESDATQSSSASSEELSSVAVTDDPIRETPNVSYTGVVKPAGISIYQQGSHRLELDDDRFVLLESDRVDLNGYVGEKVQVYGSVRPTVEAGGMIMRVERMHLLRASSVSSVMAQEEESSESSEEILSSSTSSSEVSSAIPEVIPEVHSSVSSISSLSSTASLATDETEGTTAVSFGNETQVTSMETDNYSPERWTQEYCTGHVGFCIPVHKNWWFKSFGATTTHIWHVELGNQALENLNDGAIQVQLVSGTVASKKAVDGQVRVQGDAVIGFKEWEDNSHFEIVADARLEEPVRYITEHLRKYEE